MFLPIIKGLADFKPVTEIKSAVCAEVHTHTLTILTVPADRIYIITDYTVLYASGLVNAVSMYHCAVGAVALHVLQMINYPVLLQSYSSSTLLVLKPGDFISVNYSVLTQPANLFLSGEGISLAYGG